ncbi:MAG: hypothetical protein KGL31_02385 [candidate division NC10 bacterium]|nr:hypothetical protein [candidate division NC10 bacterium]MDE2320753.1 hypothetical protein [candidate division NC10 bacterium]
MERKPKELEMKKHFEALVGHEVDAATARAGTFNLFVPKGTYSSSDGLATWVNLLFPPPFKYCINVKLRDVSGVSSTGSDGKTVFRLSEFVCDAAATGGNVFVAAPVNVVATPLAQTPSFLTLDYSLIDPTVNGFKDLEIRAYAWGANGAAAPNVVFDWRCRVVSVEQME